MKVPVDHDQRLYPLTKVFIDRDQRVYSLTKGSIDRDQRGILGLRRAECRRQGQEK